MLVACGWVQTECSHAHASLFRLWREEVMRISFLFLKLLDKEQVVWSNLWPVGSLWEMADGVSRKNLCQYEIWGSINNDDHY